MLVFQHIPKTAGMYIIKHLVDALEASRALRCVDDPAFLSHPAADFAARSFVYGHISTRALMLRMDAPRIFTCVREPVDRVVSAYFYWRDKFPEAMWYGKHSRFISVVDNTADPSADLERCLFSDELTNYGELRNLQAWMLGDRALDRRLDEAELLKRAKDHLDQVVLLGDTSNVVEVLTQAAQMLGVSLQSSATEAMVNANPVRPRTQQIPPSIRKAIEAQNNLDLEIYDYARALISRRQAPGRPPAPQSSTLIRDMGPATTPSPGAKAFLANPDYAQIEGWLGVKPIDYAAALTALQDPTHMQRRLIEFRPFCGQNLVAIGSVLPHLTQVCAVDFRDDQPIYPHSYGTRAKCTANLEKFFPQAAIALWPFASDRIDLLEQAPPDFKVSFAIISRAFDAQDVAAELIFLDTVLEEDGIVLVNGVFNSYWPQTAAGVFSWLGSSESLVPFMIHGGANMWLCRPDISGLFKDRMRCFGDARLAVVTLADRPVINIG